MGTREKQSHWFFEKANVSSWLIWSCSKILYRWTHKQFFGFQFIRTVFLAMYKEVRSINDVFASMSSKDIILNWILFLERIQFSWWASAGEAGIPYLNHVSSHIHCQSIWTGVQDHITRTQLAAQLLQAAHPHFREGWCGLGLGLADSSLRPSLWSGMA